MIVIQKHKNYEIFTLIGMEGSFKLLFHLWTHSCHCHTLPHGAYFGSRIVTYSQFVLDLRVPLTWFFIIISFFIINHIYIIILECYPGWLPSQTCWPSMGYFSLVQENPPDVSSMRLGRCCGCSVHS